MVSLGEEGNRSGGFFFDQPSHSLQSESDELLADPSINDQEVPFQKINTIPTISIIIFLLTCLEIALFVVPHFCPSTEQCGISPYSVLIYSHAGLWFIIMVVDRYWRYQHYASRTNGYLDFYRTTRHIRRAPVLVYSGGNALLLIITVVLEDYCGRRSLSTDPTTDVCPGSPLTKCNYLQLLVSIELAIILPILFLYLVRTLRFNHLRPPPDIQQEDIMSTFSQAQQQTSDVGFRDETFVDEILEKQADMIRYLKQHNQHLGKKILQLTAELGART